MGRPKKRRTYPLAVARYKERTFTRIYAEIRKEIVAEFKELTAANGDTTQGVIKKAVNDYIETHRDNKKREDIKMLTKEELIDELWEMLTKKGTVPTLTIESKNDLADEFFRSLTDGEDIDAGGLADAATRFDFDTENAKFFGINSIIEYQNITSRDDDDGEPLEWETVGYDF